MKPVDGLIMSFVDFLDDFTVPLAAKYITTYVISTFTLFHS